MNIKVRIENQTFEVNVGDLNTKPILATVDGQTFEVWPEEMPRTMATPMTFISAPAQASVATSAPAAKSAPAPLSPVPATSASTGTSTATAITAPIPGIIVAISVKEGESVKKGQELVVLEAMKMKNSIRSNRDGVIGPISIKVGDHIQQRQVLIEFKG